VRTNDLAGRPVDTAVTYPGGVNGVGFDGLRDFIPRFIASPNSSTTLAASCSPTRSIARCNSPTNPLVDTMQTNLAAQGDHFDTLVRKTIVLSPQFRNKTNTSATDADSIRKGELTMSAKKIAFPVSRRAVTPRSRLRRGAALALSRCTLSGCPTALRLPHAFRHRFPGLWRNEDHWSAEGQGADMKLSKTLVAVRAAEKKIKRH